MYISCVFSHVQYWPTSHFLALHGAGCNGAGLHGDAGSGDKGTQAGGGGSVVPETVVH